MSPSPFPPGQFHAQSQFSFPQQQHQQHESCSVLVRIVSPGGGELVRRIPVFMAHLSGWMEHWIWHSGSPFILVPADLKDVDNGVSGHGQLGSKEIVQAKVPYGDCLKDEWFIVWLCLQLSLAFPDLAISLTDGDGEFLLIEAAELLPPWMEPDTYGPNRIWIMGGELHWIPLPGQSKEAAFGGRRGKPSLTDSRFPNGNALTLTKAMVILADSLLPTQAPKWMQDIIFDRVGGWNPKKGGSVDPPDPESHTTIAFLPQKIVHLLQAHPPYISNAILALCERDVKTESYCKGPRFKFFPFISEDVDLDSTANPMADSASDQPHLIMASIKMTKMFFAQLRFSDFVPAPHMVEYFQDAYVAACESNAVLAKRWRLAVPHPDQALLSGMKITCGLEMWLREEEERLQRPLASPSDVQAMVKELSVAIISRTNMDSKFPRASDEYLYRLSKLILNRGEQSVLEDYSSIMSKFDPTSISLPKLICDSEDWLELDAASLEAKLHRADPFRTESTLPSAVDLKNDNILKRMEAFIQQESSIEGVVFPGQKEDPYSDDGEEDNHERVDPSEAEHPDLSSTTTVQCDPAQFLKSILNGLNVSKAEMETLLGGMPSEVMSDWYDDAGDDTHALGEDSDVADNEDCEGEDEPTLRDYMAAMDASLSETMCSNEHRQVSSSNDPTVKETVNLDHALVGHLLESFYAQEGGGGPVEALFHGLNLSLPAPSLNDSNVFSSTRDPLS